ncbi:MAG: NUDIX domain-containing protein [Acidobacteria bacterium]|nr:NUDIX domain-containing protein [Acidobacteriota bacterium]
MKVIRKIGLLVQRDGRILLCRKKQGTPLLILPGGKPELNETPLQCLEREITEELGVAVKCAEPVGEYSDRAAGEDAVVQIELYMGELLGEPSAQGEIAELMWWGPNDDEAQLAPSLVNHILPDLRRRGLWPQR